MRKPNFFIIGAPKCGTTTIYSWLKEHPEIFLPEVKEPHHFYSPYGKPMEKEEYESLFYDVNEKHIAIGEASVWYLFSGIAIDRILEYQPDAKFIVLIRNPIEMAPSLHNQVKVTGRELEENFEKAWNLNEERSSGNPIKTFGLENNPGLDLSFMDYKKACMLGSQLTYLYNTVKSKNILPILLDDMKKIPIQVLSNTQKFLEVKDNTDIKFEKRNESKKRKSYKLNRLLYRTDQLKKWMGLEKKSFGMLKWLWSLNTEKHKYQEPSLRMRKKMLHAFDSDISQIEELLNIDLSHWREIT
jgi:hypothetical protein